MYYILFIIGGTTLFIKENKITAFLLAILLLILSIFRYGVGPDYFSYQYLYEQLDTNLLVEYAHGVGNQEILFRLIGSTLKGFGLNYTMYIALFSIVGMYYIFKISTEYSVRPTWSIFLYYCFFYFVWTFSGLRQGFVLSIGTYYYLTCKKNDKPISFIIIILILSGIHTSAVMLLLLYYTVELSWKKKSLQLLTVLSVLISVLPLSSLFRLVQNISIFQGLVNYIPQSYTILGALDLQSLARILFLSLGLFFYNFYIAKGKMNKIIMDTFIIGLNIYFMLKTSELAAARLSIYGFYFIILIIPTIYDNFNLKINKLVFKVLLILFCFLYMNKDLNSMKINSDLITKETNIVPYTNIFNKNENYYFNTRYIDLLDIN